MLDLAPYHLDISGLNCDSLEVVFSFDFDYQGNHDEVIAEALAMGGPFEAMMQHAGARILHHEPSLHIALDEKCKLHARLWLESRTQPFQVQSGQFPEAPLSVYFVINQFWGKGAPSSFVESYHNQRRLAQEMVENYVIPNILQPLHQTIASK